MAACTAHDTNIWRVSINDLPDEIVTKILSHMSISALMDVIPKVCTRWKKLSEDKEVWTDKVYVIGDSRCDYPNTDNCKRVTTDKEATQFLCNAPNLQFLIMDRVVSSDILHMVYTRCHQLTKLCLNHRQELSYSELKNLVENCTKIQTLEISSELLKSQKYAETVSQFQQLRVLYLRSSTESPPVLQPVADGCPQLSELYFFCKTVNMDDMRHFLNAKRNTLKSIYIYWTVSGRCVLPLLTVCADSLKCLELYNYDVVDHEAREAFHALGSLTNLQQLKMQISEEPPPPNTIPVAFRSGGLSKLKLLDLENGWRLDNDTIIAVCSGCPALQHLIVKRAILLSDAAFSQIHLLENLEILDVSCCKGLGSALIPCLTRLPKLHTLLMEYLCFPKLQPGLSSILDLSCLRCLILNGSTLTGIPFYKFPGKLFCLRELHIKWCIGKYIAIDMLQDMPDLKIYADL